MSEATIYVKNSSGLYERVGQQSDADQGELAPQSQQTLTDSTGGTSSTTLAAITDASTANAVASLNAQLDNVKADITEVRRLLSQLRTDLINLGLIKGSA